MATTSTLEATYSAPTYNYDGWSVAKDYFMHRRKLDRASEKRSSNYRKPDPTFSMMPLNPHSKTNHASNNISLLRLPRELILEIAELLAPIDLISFRTTSKYIRSLTSTKRIQSRLQGLPIAVLDEYAWRLHKDCFNRLVEYEQANDVSIKYTPCGKLLCSYCVDFHQLSAFDVVDRLEDGSRGAYRKQCTASRAKVYVCPHIQLAFEDLLRLRKNPRKCLRCPLCTSSYTPSTNLGTRQDCFSLEQKTFLFLDFVDGLWRAQYYPALIDGKISHVSLSVTTTTLTLVRAAIDGASVYLCPHVKIKKRIYSMLKAMMENSSVYRKIGIGLLHVSRCGKTGCGAELDVILDGWGITIEARRILKVTTVMAKD